MPEDILFAQENACRTMREGNSCFVIKKLHLMQKKIKNVGILRYFYVILPSKTKFRLYALPEYNDFFYYDNPIGVSYYFPCVLLSSAKEENFLFFIFS